MPGLLRTTLLCAIAVAALAASGDEVRVSSLDLAQMTCGWSTPRKDAAISGTPLSLRGLRFEHGIGTHAPSHLRLALDGRAIRLRGYCGLDDDSAHTPAAVQFAARVDGRIVWQSPVLRGTSEACKVSIPLTGAKDLLLSVTDGGDGTSSDHADWAGVVIDFDGAAPVAVALMPERAEVPGGPPNAPATLTHDAATGQFTLQYDGATILSGRIDPGAQIQSTCTTGRVVEQRLRIAGSALRAAVRAGPEGLAAETRGPAQQRFPLVRTTHGTSSNLRNNAVYDRGRDWMLEGPSGATVIRPATNAAGDAAVFTWSSAGPDTELVFRPRYFQRHRNLPHFAPWTYRVRRDSITGWSSWWAYMRDFKQRDLDGLLAVWKEHRFADYGYRFIQIDECFHQELGAGQARPIVEGAHPGSYVSRGPETWLDWRKDAFPAGMRGYVDACRGAGFDPAIWIGTFFTDRALIASHPDWFVRGTDGKPFIAPWASCGVDATNPEAIDQLVARTYRGLHDAGFRYVKIDQLRHYLYDNLHRNPEFCLARGQRPDEIFRAYLGTARRELGAETFLLACWGVLPEAIGLADACRIGGDGYGPVTMQQYNSFNGIVWRNDPDHCDVYPRFKPAEAGNVQKTAAVAAAPNDTVIRPALASLAGCMLMLSDRPEVYRDERNLRGLRAASPVLFSVPGQLYDYDASKTERLRTMTRTDIRNGGPPAPVDADQFGTVCPWWLNEIDRPFEHWNVLHRLNWTAQPTGPAQVAFADLGLDPAADHLVYEFWTGRFRGVKRGGFEALPQGAMELHSYAIRTVTPHPQLVSTSRHLSQGGVDLVTVEWNAAAGTLSGRSRVIAGAPYELVLYVPDEALQAVASGPETGTHMNREGPLVRVRWTPATTGEQPWRVVFKK